jgi:hypothetical protein
MKYIKYLLYILEHKNNVFKACWKRGLYLHAFTHDLSKFLPDEFFPYANWFYGFYGKRWKDECKEQTVHLLDNESLNRHLRDDFNCQLYDNEELERSFNKAWENHKRRNKHHWNYYSEIDIGQDQNTYIDMPKKYILQMICDWEGMSMKFGDTAKDYYEKNKNNIKLSDKSRKILEELL